MVGGELVGGGCWGARVLLRARVQIAAGTANKERRGGQPETRVSLCSAQGLAAGQGIGIGELRILVVVVFGCVLISGQHELSLTPPPPCPASPSCSVFCCWG
jgi:hypothetical protein